MRYFFIFCVYKTDYHTHTFHSDGRSNAEEYIEAAIKRGFSEIGISDHILICKTDETWCMAPPDLDNYYKNISLLRESTKQISVKVGLEVDYIEGKERDIEKMLEKYDLDYRIGSVHFIKGMISIDSSPEIYVGKDFDFLFKSYFDAVTKAVKSGLFDIIGHFDLIRIFCQQPSFDPSPLYRDFSKCLKKNDVVFELNTNGRNKPLKDFYPDRRFLGILADDKNKVCVNSDAHFAGLVGQHFEEAYRLLRSVGFTEMATFTKRKREMVPIPR
ncbi:MAG: histidinol-phosphatase [Bacteroidales bacterium]|jgi:histidinol-phosphatase (PHP family)